MTTGPGQVLLAVYAIFALAAGARSGVQIATRFAEAPLAYVLSAVAAVIYLSATVLLRLALTGRAVRRPLAVLSGVELLGVLAVGTASVLAPAAFPDATVWSTYGAGYGFVPAVLPILVLWWCRSAVSRAPESVRRPRSRP